MLSESLKFSNVVMGIVLYAEIVENIGSLSLNGTAPLTGERAQASLRGRPRGRLGTEGSGKGCLRGRPRGRFGKEVLTLSYTADFVIQPMKVQPH